MAQAQKPPRSRVTLPGGAALNPTHRQFQQVLDKLRERERRLFAVERDLMRARDEIMKLRRKLRASSAVSA